MSFVFHNWQSGQQPGAPYTRCSPNLMLIHRYMKDRWGGQNLGCYYVRTIAGTDRYSSHAFGAAFDHGIGERHGSRGIAVAEAEILPWLTDNYEALGIQGIHAYWRTNKRMWRVGRGWYDGNPGRGNDWIHIEVPPETWNLSTPIEQRLRPPLGAKVSRISGNNRYATAVEVSKKAFPKGAPVAYVVSGAQFADALSVGPLAGTQGPILLTERDSLPPVTVKELQRLKPKEIVIVGGPAAVSVAVENQLKKLTA